MQLQDVVALETELSAAPTKVPEGDVISLKDVLKEVQDAIDEYHSGLGGGNDMLDPLLQVQVDFKTTIAVTAGFTINILIFKFGVSVKKENLHEISFTYVPKPPAMELLGGDAQPPELKKALAKAIQEAAKAKKAAEVQAAANNWEIKQVDVNIQFGVTWDGNASATVPVSLITIGPNMDISKASVHFAKVSFAKPEKKPAPVEK